MPTNPTPPPVTLERKPGSHWSEEDIEHGIVAMIECHGSSRNAEKLLEAQGRKIPYGTLQKWKDDLHKQRYLSTEKRVREDIWARTASYWHAASENAAGLTNDTIDAGRKAVQAGDAKEAATWASAAQRFATAGAIGTDKAAAIEGRPMGAPHEGSSLKQLLRGLERFAGNAVRVNWDTVDSTATDVTEPRSLSASSTPGPTRADEQTRDLQPA